MDKIDKINNLILQEKKHASSLSTSVDGIKNIVVKEILRGIARDSLKHAGFYSSILSLLNEEAPVISEEDFDLIEEVIKKHIEVETRMIKEAKNLMASEEDIRIQHLLKEIFEDEVKHHNLMKRLLDSIIKRETLFEQDIWDILWSDTPGHGAPLG
jgi:rubrerythrin